jgi:hypothetical protein
MGSSAKNKSYLVNQVVFLCGWTKYIFLKYIFYIITASVIIISNTNEVRIHKFANIEICIILFLRLYMKLCQYKEIES